MCTILVGSEGMSQQDIVVHRCVYRMQASAESGITYAMQYLAILICEA